MSEVSPAVSDAAFSALSENLAHVLQTRAMLGVVAPDVHEGQVVVQAALARQGQDAVLVAAAEPGSRAALLDAFYAALRLDRHGPRPRRRFEARQAIDDELARRSAPTVIVRDAHLLRTEALLCLASMWSCFQRREPRMAIVLLGTEQLRAVLQRPALAGLRTSIYIWQRLSP